MTIGILSDTHSYLHPGIFEHLSDCEEIWHAGDIGNFETLDKLQAFKKTRAVFGNIDHGVLRDELEEFLSFRINGIKVCITHIGGYPDRYVHKVKKWLLREKPDLFICGHSHILKVIPDKELALLHINPGAAGFFGFHKKITFIKLDIIKSKMSNLRVIEYDRKKV